MSKENKLIPELRFPEFVKEGEWQKKTIEEIAKVSAGGTPESTNPEYWNGDIPWMNSGELNNKRIYSVSNYITSKGLKESSTKLIPPNCVLIGLAGQGKTRGTAAINYIELCTNQSIGSIHPNENVFNSEFLYQNVDSIYEKLRFLSAGDGGRGGLNLQIIKELELLLPKLNEQQKIASCLSSLDEVIATHNQKLKDLKIHKKGLMQNLFPQEGETVPKWRFKEFEKDGEWEEKSFEHLFEIGNGRDYKHLDKGQIPVYGSGGFMLSVNEYLYDGESVCIGRKGTIDKPMFLTGKFWTVDTLFYTHSFNDCLPKYIFYVFENINWREHNEAGGVPSLSKTNIYKIKILVPQKNKVEEQQKIASCLSSLDALITAQTEKIEQLKMHKKGLMQGLFPKIKE